MRRSNYFVRGFVVLVGLALTLPVVIGAESTSARSEIRLELAELMVGDARYWEALTLYDRAKDGAQAEQLIRASSGLLRSLLRVGEFSRARLEADFLNSLGLTDPHYRALYADALWAFGLFQEAEEIYENVLTEAPGNAVARHGVGRSLAARGRTEEALVELHAAISVSQNPEFSHTLGTVYRRLGRYEEAADALENYIEGLPEARRNERSEWSRSEVRFLRSFGDSRPLQITPEHLADAHTVPFRLERDKVIVRGRVNGTEIDLVVDTGAEQMVLSKPSAQLTGVRPVTNILSAGVGRVGFRGLESGKVDTLDVGTLRVENVPTLIKNPPLTGLPDTRSENSFSPLALGLSTVVDYKTQELTVAQNLPDEPAADIEMPMRFHRLAMVRGVINGEHEKSFIVDTGGEEISISLSTANTLGMIPPRYIPLRVFGMSGWDQDAFLLPGVDLTFNKLAYDNLSVVVLNLHRPSALLGVHIGGIIGHRFLSNYRVAVDLNDSVLRLTEH